MTGYNVPAGYGEAEYIEKRSRFIGRVWHIEDEAEALSHIKEMRKIHWDAAHNVYAYSIRDGNIARFSDDSEPSGTAGMPVLEVLRRNEICNFCCVVTRYFGGVLLGAGGLIRAYAHSAKIALDAAGTAVVSRWVIGTLSCGYPMLERLKIAVSEHCGTVRSIDYGADVVIEALFPEERVQAFSEAVIDLTGGKTQFQESGEEQVCG